MLDGLCVAIGDVTLFGDFDSAVSGTAAAPSEVDEEEAEDAEDDLGKGFAELIFESEGLFDS